MRLSRTGRAGGSRGLLRAGAIVAALGILGFAAPAFAADGSIDHVESDKGTVKILYSLPGLSPDTAPDLANIKVSLDGKPLDATAAPASDPGNTVRRTAILAMDVSNSMGRDNKFTEAKLAAETFLDTAPPDVYVGIVTFANDVKVAQAPTLDRAASKDVISKLTLSLQTRLYDGVKLAVQTAGKDGQRSVLVLSDGRDTSQTPLSSATDLISKSDVKVDVVALAQSAADQALLRPMSDAGGGAVLPADDPKALTQVFESEAQQLASQVLITADQPAGVSEGTLSVSLSAGGDEFSDSAYVTLADSAKEAPAVGPSTDLAAATSSGLSISPTLMLVGLGAAAVGVTVILVGVVGAGGKKTSIDDHIAAYTRKGKKRGAAAASTQPQTMTAQAVGIAAKALESSGSFESKLGDKLEAAGMAFKPAEWLLLHAGIAFGAATLGFLISSGGFLISVVFFIGGVVVPWLFLKFKRGRRLKAFNGQLAEVLQMLAGSLQAGLSMAQAIDTVVREGGDPIAGEFRRALIETRLGVQIEDALESVAARMESADFKWTVMAIRIQREVGGNLAELLLNVAATLRERDYLRRQVKTLSAEGRMSAYILGGLPPGVILYMMMVNPTYLHPMLTTPLGWMMMGAMGVMMFLGIFWMSRMTKMEV